METEVFVEDEPEPILSTLTLFSDNVAYDFLRSGPEEITMYDAASDRLVLMDTRRRVKTTLTTDEITHFVEQMKEQLSEVQRQALLDTEVSSTTDEDGVAWFLVSSDQVEYRARGVRPRHTEAALEYQRFADLYARLNSMRLGNLPPYARLKLNAALAEQDLIPEEVQRSIRLSRPLASDTEHVILSRHTVQWRLSHQDRQMIDRAGNYLAGFREVRFSEYLDLPPVDAEVDEQP